MRSWSAGRLPQKKSHHLVGPVLLVVVLLLAGILRNTAEDQHIAFSVAVRQLEAEFRQ